MKNTIYQTGPMFTEAERAWHKGLSLRLQKEGMSVFWPGDLMGWEGEGGVSQVSDEELVASSRKGLLDSSAVVAVLDGSQVQDAVAWEIGFAVANNIPVFGILTDIREPVRATLHPYLASSLTMLSRSIPELVTQLKEGPRKQGPESEICEVCAG